MEFDRNLEKISLKYELTSAFYRGVSAINWLLKELPLMSAANFVAHRCLFFLCCSLLSLGRGGKFPSLAKVGRGKGLGQCHARKIAILEFRT